MKCFVGLDVSSTKLDVCIMLSDTTTPFTASLPNDLISTQEFKNQILNSMRFTLFSLSSLAWKPLASIVFILLCYFMKIVI